MSQSIDLHLVHSVPQSYRLRPLLFALDTNPLFDLIKSHLKYTAVTMNLGSTSPSNFSTSEDTAVIRIDSCVSDTRKWLLNNSSFINGAKTEFHHRYYTATLQSPS
ncbi:Retrovirus-related Pol polyprotein from transposon opus [Oopsacas minuta]|uniref:Retrovirus-related Pol polyprotein from transposon opus n=1 Tax=Oopsacas minuta TaxID=111878 RepID=A0AAV7JJF2_9METZ|nr:Retrovirus-related Pol polyprotein from transposon opus [Oopsacas minuta]